MVKAKIDDLEDWLFRVDRALVDFKMPSQIYDTVEEIMASSIRFSTYELFHNMPFYRILSPTLKKRLAKEVLQGFY